MNTFQAYQWQKSFQSKIYSTPRTQPDFAKKINIGKSH